MNRSEWLLPLLAALALIAAPALCDGTSRPPLAVSPPERIDIATENMPPLPYEQDIIEAVYARFPEVNRDEVEKFLRANFDEELRTFRSLSFKHRDQSTEIYSKMVREALSLLEIRKRNPALYEKKILQKNLDGAARRLAREVRLTGNPEEKKKVAKRLRDTVNRMFDVRQEIMKADIEQMSEELAGLRELVRKRESSRDAIVERRVTDMLGERHPMDW